MERTRLQDALDAAVIAGAMDDGGTWQTRAEGTLFAQYAAGETAAISKTFTKSPAKLVVGNASKSVPTFFGGLVGLSAVTVAARAEAQGVVATNTVCILVKSKTASQSLLVNSGANVNATNCRIDVASTANPAAIFNSGTNLQFKDICIAGSNIIDNGGTHPNLAKSCTTITDPFAGQLPTPASATCTQNGGNWNGGTINLTPGVYCGWYNLNNAPTINFAPGVYVIKGGGVNVNGGTWNGTGVTFYFADNSKIQFNSSVKTYLKAPTSGTYEGILMYEKEGLSTSDFVWNNATGHALEGLIYLPSRNMTFNSGADVTADKLSLVVNTLILNSMTWNFGPTSSRTMSASASAGTGKVYLSH